MRSDAYSPRDRLVSPGFPFFIRASLPSLRDPAGAAAVFIMTDRRAHSTPYFTLFSFARKITYYNIFAPEEPFFAGTYLFFSFFFSFYIYSYASSCINTAAVTVSRSAFFVFRSIYAAARAINAARARARIFRR